YYRSVCGKQGDELRRAVHDLLITTHTSVGFRSGLLDAIAAVDAIPGGRVKLLHTEDGAEAHVNGSNGTELAWAPGFTWPQELGVGHESYTCAGACASGNAMSDLHHQFAGSKAAVAARAFPPDYTTADVRHFKKTAMLYGSCDGRCQAPAAAPDAQQTYGWSPNTELLEPPAEVRGDVARALFYMAVRYDGDDGVVDLELKDFLAEEDPRCCRDDDNYRGCSSEVCYMGQLSALLRWHLEDPVSDEERARNAAVQARFQGNRNPFVDLPQLAWLLFVEEGSA
ncbi:endonuclease I-domain-containing protein, partial [Baffinella frigidus]